ncbi:MAG: LON peptidase substrate-binding domain-containing protein [Algoriphagus sp.]|uniref:LON peptidase substrate-binding domain-containing protein n=1 Tax=Algoriphagus sp. TaxID=1872435 RepID=UPI0017D16CA8|nr:LON peptidase substrate-binding domain-containing protein [Algoriphagus sp.]NVJ87522.1 LON peptidase substrate-binding domain-containing protein [Algoriphagus sp.]
MSTAYLPLFPLKLVVFPGENLNLHIFEPRYRQLLADVEEGKLAFGICTYLNQLTGLGTEVVLDKIYKRYPDGRLDIKTRGKRVFRILSFDNPMEGKLYAGGNVQYLENSPVASAVQNHEFLFYLKEMLYLLHFSEEIKPELTNSFTYAHKVGLKFEEELELLQITEEGERMDYLINHFKRVIPVIKNIERAKEIIKQNGHFKNLDPLDF